MGAEADTTFVVTKTADTNDGVCDADCSLREAVNAANAVDGSDTISLPERQVFALTIPGYGDDTGASGDLDIASEIVIEGAGSTVDQHTNERVFHVLLGADAELRDLTVTGGEPDPGDGGGIYNAGRLTVLDSTITGNAARGGFDGGGIFNSADGAILRLERSTVSSNEARRGGGVLGDATSSVLIRDSHVAHNSAAEQGGGAYTTGSFSVDASRFEDNSSAGSGGGLWASYGSISGSLFARNVAEGGAGGGLAVVDGLVMESVVADNEAATNGGGISTDGRPWILRTTITRNRAQLGGGVHVAPGTPVPWPPSASITHSTVARNVATSDGGGVYASADLDIRNSTISANAAAANGGGIRAADGVTSLLYATVTDNAADDDANNTGDGGGIAASSVASTARTKASIIEGNTDRSPSSTVAPDCSGALSSNDYNVLGVVAGCITIASANDVTGDAQLSALTFNGGSTETHAIAGASPAKDRVPPGPDCEQLGDQRGVNRPVGAGCDSGSYELALCDGAVVNVVANRATTNGTPGPDVILDDGDSATINGLGGDDRICSGAGNDFVDGGEGNDRIFGEEGRDKLLGGVGDDYLDGGTDRDTCKGQAGRDRIRGCERGKA